MARDRSVLIIAALLGALLLGGVDCSDAAQPAFSTRITAAELVRRVNTPAAPLILDVRSADEYATGHVPGAINIPHVQLAARLGELRIDKSDELVVYCLAGPRAALAQQVLTRAGYTRVRQLDGQMRAWRQEGYPTE